MQYNNSFTAFVKEAPHPFGPGARARPPRSPRPVQLLSRQTAVLSVTVAAVLLIAARPRRVPVWVWPCAGALALVVLGMDPPGAAPVAIGRQWNVIAFILGLMGLSAAAEESGAFAWITELLLTAAGGSRRKLFVWLFLASGVTTVALSNDATAIALTPIVYAAVSRRGGQPMPYLYACAFAANTASFGLPFSNPANVLILPHANGLAYAATLGPLEAFALAANLGIFLLVFRRDLEGCYAIEKHRAPPPRAKRALMALAGVVAMYCVALVRGWALGPIALAGAAATLTAGEVSFLSAARRIRWGTFALLAGLFALLDAVARTGFLTWAQDSVTSAAHFGSLATIVVPLAGAALLSNLLNNLPVAIAAGHLSALRPQHLAYPLILGVDLGPSLTIAGSLSTILWASTLRDRGVRVDPWQYLRLGLLVVPVLLLLCALWLWLLPH